jgi:hypothetical protein
MSLHPDLSQLLLQLPCLLKPSPSQPSLLIGNIEAIVLQILGVSFGVGHLVLGPLTIVPLKTIFTYGRAALWLPLERTEQDKDLVEVVNFKQKSAGTPERNTIRFEISI